MFEQGGEAYNVTRLRHMYEFEGEDYTVKKEDAAALDAMMDSEEAEKRKREEEEREAKRVKMDEERKRRDEAKKLEKEKLWEENGYISYALDTGDIPDMVEMEDKKEDLMVFQTGSVVAPVHEENRREIMIQYVLIINHDAV